MYENDILFDGDFTESVATDTNATEIDYQKLEQCYYNAIKRLDYEKSVQDQIRNVSPDSDLVEFSSETDAKLYTVGVDVAPTTCAQQNTTYLLDIRNILLIFLLAYFCITVYSKLKTTMINYTK